VRSRPLALVGLGALAAACGAGGNPSWRGHGNGPGEAPNGAPGGTTGGVQASREYVPPGSSPVRYNDPADAANPPHSPVADAVVAAVQEGAREAGDPVPAADARLFGVAQDLAEYLQPGELPPYAAIEFSLAFHGLVEPSPEIILLEGDERAPEQLGQAVREKLPQSLSRGDFARVGVGIVHGEGSTVRAVLALQQVSVDTDPFPRGAAIGQSVKLRGQVRAPYGEPTLFVTGQNGQVDRPPVVRDGGAGFRAEIACQAAGTRQVEVIGRGPAGVTVLANFPLYCGVDAPRTLSIAAPGGANDTYADAKEAEQLIFAQLNRDRAAHQLPALVWDERAANISRAHSADMQANDFVAHVSPRTGNAGDRARAAGLASPMLLENVARAYSPSEVQTGFMNSPGHRANVLSKDATHVGVGVVLGREVNGKRELYVTQLFFRVPPRIPLAQAHQQAVGALVAARKAAGVAELRADVDLEDIAQDLARDLARGDNKDAAARRADQRTEKLASRYSSIITVVVVVGDPTTFTDDSVLDGRARHYGLGLAQGNHPELGQDAFYVVVLLARPR
jgi:uncharacterized protein YkwD